MLALSVVIGADGGGEVGVGETGLGRELTLRYEASGMYNVSNAVVTASAQSSAAPSPPAFNGPGVLGFAFGAAAGRGGDGDGDAVEK